MPSDDFTHIVDAYYTSLYRFAYSLARNASDAADLTQQTFLIFAKRGQTLQDDRKAKAWLFTTLYREFLRLCRRAKHTEALEDLEPTEAELAVPVEDFFAQGRTGLVPEALHAVDELYRVPLTLFYLQEFSYREISDMLSVPVGTVMSRLARGRAQLRDALAQAKSGGAIKPLSTSTS